jgi:hypothetical protein
MRDARIKFRAMPTAKAKVRSVKAKGAGKKQTAAKR